MGGFGRSSRRRGQKAQGSWSTTFQPFFRAYRIEKGSIRSTFLPSVNLEEFLRWTGSVHREEVPGRPASEPRQFAGQSRSGRSGSNRRSDPPVEMSRPRPFSMTPRKITSQAALRQRESQAPSLFPALRRGKDRHAVVCGLPRTEPFANGTQCPGGRHSRKSGSGADGQRRRDTPSPHRCPPPSSVAPRPRFGRHGVCREKAGVDRTQLSGPRPKG